ncbi:MAG: glutaredoxin 3 [Gammaproteobacteria bacterium]|nr:glutaredoxin 3 [Gammaproteobacteria bacterium]MBT5205388.1 glutaredoxin 3 [Gammaproteobacteria bacterium]MBT5603484.1 glutaredoxin 3 [Gammaproteobacteria bacterium]MBT6245152.1 glutaredoxin 3 [Gammaproteobacteria bacterium]
MNQSSVGSSNVTIYTTVFCPFCIRAKMLLKSKGVPFTEIPVDFSRQKRREMEAEANSHTVPQIWIGDYHVGGCDELYQLERNGDLEKYLENLQ